MRLAIPGTTPGHLKFSGGRNQSKAPFLFYFPQRYNTSCRLQKTAANQPTDTIEGDGLGLEVDIAEDYDLAELDGIQKGVVPLSPEEESSVHREVERNGIRNLCYYPFACSYKCPRK